MNKTLWILLLVLSPAFVHAGTHDGELRPTAETKAGFEVPGKFVIHEKFFSWPTATFAIKDGKRGIGEIHEKFFSLTRSFDLNDASGKKVATARQKFFSWGVEIEVFDAQGAKIGTIKEEIFKSLLKWRTSYKILDASGKQVAESDKVDWIVTSFRLKDMHGKELIQMRRPFFRLTDDWEVTNNDTGKVIDPRVFVMIGAYKTSVDNERRRERSQTK